MEKLGEGTYGVVFRAVDNRTQETVALKRIQIEQEEDGITSSTVREIAVLKALNHINVIHIRDVIQDDSKIILILEFMDRDLKKHLARSKRPMPFELIRSYSYQLICGIAYLHANRVIHRDIKPANLLINKIGILKINDFGSSRFYSIPLTPFTPNVTTVWYRAPEVLFGIDTYGLGVDIWSAGCVIAEMVNGFPLFAGDSDIDQIMKIFEILGTPTEETWPGYTALPFCRAGLPVFDGCGLRSKMESQDPDLIDLLEKILTLDPKKRISAAEALQHPFFQNIPDQLVDICLPEIE